MKGVLHMDAFIKAGKTAEEMFEKTIIFTEEIAVKAVDVIDAVEEMVMDLPHNVKKRTVHLGHASRRTKAKRRSGPA